MKTQGKASAICSGRLTRLGISPLKIRDIWNTIEVAPRMIHKLLESDILRTRRVQEHTRVWPRLKAQNPVYVAKPPPQVRGGG